MFLYWLFFSSQIRLSFGRLCFLQTYVNNFVSSSKSWDAQPCWVNPLVWMILHNIRFFYIYLALIQFVKVWICRKSSDKAFLNLSVGNFDTKLGPLSIVVFQKPVINLDLNVLTCDTFIRVNWMCLLQMPLVLDCASTQLICSILKWNRLFYLDLNIHSSFWGWRRMSKNNRATHVFLDNGRCKDQLWIFIVYIVIIDIAIQYFLGKAVVFLITCFIIVIKLLKLVFPKHWA